MPPASTPSTPLAAGASYDALIIGAGFGGLGAAVELARRGARVALCEALTYPGGCASTFRRKGYAFEAGATLFSGFGEEQLFGRWIRELDLPVTIDLLDPVVELRAPSFHLPVPLDRDALIDNFARLEGAPVGRLRAFFDDQRSIADVLWRLFDDPDLLPPFDIATIARHAARSPRYLALLPLLGRSLARLLNRHELQRFTPLRVYLDALCQITVQCSSAEAEATFALAAMDYYWRGTGHVRGGIGVLARALCDGVRALGGEVFFANAVKAIHPEKQGFRVITRRGEIRARAVVANVLPQGLRRLLAVEEGALPHLDRLAARVETGWGAAMLYLVVEPPEGAGESAHHLQIVEDEGAPLLEGNHVFVSISGARDPDRAPAGLRTITCSSHVPMDKLRALAPAEQGAYIAAIQARMRRSLEARAPEWTRRVRHAETASPRTFARFTGRFWGYVGGVPRRAGLDAYAGLGPTPILPRLYLAGDSVFPGQSTLATAVGGARVAERITRDLGGFAGSATAGKSR